jgi:LysM repeat protein
LGGQNQSASSCEHMKRKLILACLLFVGILWILLGNSTFSSAQAGDPGSVVDAVNNLRAANGLAPLQTNSILMSIAQGHSDYQAAIGQVTHTGAGGTRPKDRAAAAGYGGGGTFFISENIAGGNDLSVDGVISMWLGDDLHTQTMLGANYQDIGAGVTVSNGFAYYTIDVAYVPGASSASPPGGNSNNPTSVHTPGGPTPIPIYLVETATPNPDGSVVHVVRSGQTLIDIAKAYGLTVAEIKDLNYLTSDTIYVGDKLIIHAASTQGPTTTTTATTTPTRVASPTRKPTRTPTPSSSPVATIFPTQADPALKVTPQPASDPLGNILVVAIIVLAAGGVILMIVGSFIRRSDQG